MLLNPNVSFLAWSYSLDATPSITPGVTVTPGAGSKGSYVQLASGANLTQDVYGVLLWVIAGNTSGSIRDILIDLGTDPAGGTSYSQVVGLNNILASQASNAVDGGRWFYFPLFIKSGTSVGARAQSNVATTVNVAGRFYGRPSHYHLSKAGQYSETVGVSGNTGTSVTCGNTGAEGAWTSIGTTTRRCWHWTLCVAHDVGTTTAQMYYFDLAYGDGSNKVIIIENQPHFNPGTTERTGNIVWPACFCDVPEGSTLYVRGSASGTAQTTRALAVGIGG